MKGQYYDIADPTEIDLLKSQLGQVFAINDEMETNKTFELLDTFDWRMYRKGLQVVRYGRHWKIIERETEKVVGSIDVDNGKSKKFHWDFPVSEFSGFLAPALEMRALLPIVNITKRVTQFKLCNEDEKIVARLHFEFFFGEGETKPVVRCRPFPVRGYKKEFKRVKSSIDDLSFPVSTRSPGFTIIERSGMNPGAYSSKINITLAPALPVAEAVRRIMANLVEVMHLNLPGVLQDIDSEFLHDFRVSVRRSRSLLGQLKGFLDPETTAMLQSQLKKMGGITGTVRDLDVYLLEEANYIEMVPQTLQAGIRQFFSTLKRKRRYAKDKMVREMNGESFAEAMDALDAYVQANMPVGIDASKGSPTILEVAKMVIYKRYRRIVKKGRKITDSTPDEKLHELRIDCKKLRYLLEFFTSLFPRSEMKALIKQLKQLQENLGDFNDLSVQQEFLGDYLNTIKPQTAHVVMLAASVGGLIARLETAHREVRSQFLHVFETFNAPANEKLYKTLFA